MRLVVRLLAGALILVITFAAGRLTHAQARGTPQIQSVPRPATVLTGNDIGFRVDRQKGDTPVGEFVVRINGQWVEPEFSVGVKRLTSR